MLKKKSPYRIVNFVASVYAPMFLRVHLKPRAFDGPENAMIIKGSFIILQSTRPNTGVQSHQKVLFETCCSLVESH